MTISQHVRGAVQAVQPFANAIGMNVTAAVRTRRRGFDGWTGDPPYSGLTIVRRVSCRGRKRRPELQRCNSSHVMSTPFCLTSVSTFQAHPLAHFREARDFGCLYMSPGR
jgi:hypothetical protein